MKTLIVIFLFSTTISYSQKCKSSKYEKIVKYIAKIEKINPESIYLSDTIVYLEYINFINIDKKESVIKFDSTIKLDELRFFKPYYSKEITLLNKNKKSNYILFFSQEFQHTMLVELIKESSKPFYSHSKYTLFGETNQYFIQFNKKSKIIRHKKIVMNYN